MKQETGLKPPVLYNRLAHQPKESAMNNTAADHHTTTPAPHGPFGWLVAVIVLVAIGLTACGSSSTPHVASLPTSSNTAGGGTPVSTSTTATDTHSQRSRPAKAGPTALLVQWADCMQAHGDPGQAAPTIDANKVIHMTWNVDIPGGIYGTNKGGQGNAGPGQYCRTYIDKAETDLQGDQHQQQPSHAQLVRFSQCMRANGIPDFPDPSNGGLAFNRAGGGDLNPSNPVFQKASTLCARKNDMPGFATGGAPQPGSVEFNGDGTGGAGG
jgi:hypothetical protein